jgi:hypothetical protein
MSNNYYLFIPIEEISSTKLSLLIQFLKPGFSDYLQNAMLPELGPKNPRTFFLGFLISDCKYLTIIILFSFLSLLSPSRIPKPI